MKTILFLLRSGNSSRVESLPGGSYTGDIDDVKYLRDKLFSALKVPMSYLSEATDKQKIKQHSHKKISDSQEQSKDFNVL